MKLVIWIGAAVTLAGLLLICICAARALSARRAGLDDQTLRERLRPLLIINMAGLFVSCLGLMTVVVGAILA